MRKIEVIILLTLVLYSVSLAQGPPHELREGDLTVLDTGTRLRWVKSPSQFGKMTWNDACVFVENLECDGFTDWRLPSGLNLDGSLCDTNQPGVSGCPETEMGHLRNSHMEGGEVPPFESVSVGYLTYWTANEYPPDTTKAMAYTFAGDIQFPMGKDLAEAFVWPVRDEKLTWIYKPFVGWIILFMITITVVSCLGYYLATRSKRA